MEETGFIPQPGGYEEDPAPITTLSDMSDNKDLDSEFEELVVDAKSAQNSANINTNEPKEDFFLAVNQSPKRTVANLASKPLGSISPILNRKFNLSGLQSPLKTQPKETPKPSPMKTGEDLQRPSVPPPPPPPSRPPVPPRPQIRLTSASSETSLLESADPPVPVPTPAEKSPEKLPVNAVAEEKAAPKPTEAKPDAKLDAKLDEAPEGAGGAGRDSLDERTVSWESPETAFRAKSGRWPRNTAAAVLEVEAPHRFLNAALWCKDPFRPGALLCLGHASLRLEHLALECMATSSAEYQGTFRLRPPEPRASVSRTALRGLSSHKGFNEKLCYGDLTLHFCYPAEPGEPDNWPGPFGRERAGSLMDDEERERERESAPSAVAAATRDELAYGALHLSEVRHNFQDTQFQNPTWCEYCKKKVWTKAASQCMVCSYVCHKKCQDKCLAESPLCALAAAAAAERRGADPEANKSAVNRATGLTRHIINTSSRLLNLRQAQRARLAEQVQEVGGAGAAGAEPSPKHTPNTSDNESSDTETYAAGASPSKAATTAAAASGKLMRKDGGLDDSVFIAVKEIGRDLYRGLPTDERSQKLELMLDKLQQEIDQELEHNNALLAEERQAGDGRRRALTAAALAKSGERLQALTLLTIHYRAGIEDLESVESTSPSEPKGKEGLEEEGVGGGTLGAEPYDGDLCSPGGEGLDDITEEQICVEALH
ncbi:unnamed protein product [Menidia menidia]|uniref:(Atlantic silverside) hypothetical protein n=1 Tax=Menidia menidia TaxID=238744 RepID=A0A8S4BXL0_9TELE|nr:unnamed protein product [Menidia menidia]